MYNYLQGSMCSVRLFTQGGRFSFAHSFSEPAMKDKDKNDKAYKYLCNRYILPSKIKVSFSLVYATSLPHYITLCNCLQNRYLR